MPTSRYGFIRDAAKTQIGAAVPGLLEVASVATPETARFTLYPNAEVFLLWPVNSEQINAYNSQLTIRSRVPVGVTIKVRSTGLTIEEAEEPLLLLMDEVRAAISALWITGVPGMQMVEPITPVHEELYEVEQNTSAASMVFICTLTFSEGVI